MAPPSAQLLRELSPRVLGALVRRFGDFAAAEDALQEALTAAAFQWPRTGMPDDPHAWLFQVAARKLTDALRADSARRRREERTVTETPEDERVVRPPDEAHDAGDDTLALLVMCCHPALTRASSIALTLRAVGGLTTREIATAFLVPESTMAQRISRAKQTIQASGVGFALPPPDERAERLDAVLHVLYLVFNEGYAPSSGPGTARVDLSREAIRLARALHERLPADPGTTGLLALMLLTDARRPARSGPDGELVPLDEQDRSLWDAAAIREGSALVSEAMSRGVVGAYLVQAAIAGVHDAAPRAEDTDWPRIVSLYRVLLGMADNPVIALNHAVAVAMVEGPAAGLALLAPLETDPRVAAGHRLEAVRAHLLERAGDRSAALRCFESAARKTASVVERAYLLRKARALRGAP